MKKRYVNIIHVVELIELPSYDNKPLTRIKLLNGDFIDVQDNVSNLMKLFNQ